jgi:hypothetical protein
MFPVKKMTPNKPPDHIQSGSPWKMDDSIPNDCPVSSNVSVKKVVPIANDRNDATNGDPTMVRRREFTLVCIGNKIPMTSPITMANIVSSSILSIYCVRLKLTPRALEHKGPMS